jgi:wyosine [tRNA(Phe)-imidazoG37] synthetase (radical SAM superfamily)
MASSDTPPAPAEQHLFGPLRSRRLGLSLGIDVIPHKTCSLDCIYCEVGVTTRFSVDPAPYYDVEALAAEIEAALTARPDIEWVTFSGSGEPTLNSLLGPMIREVKQRTGARVAVITNGTLLWRPEVRRALCEADAVLPSLDAVSVEAFHRISRPHPLLDAPEIVDGLVAFRREYGGPIWLEILFVAGINDSDEEVAKLRDAVERIRPDKLHLNTVVRPPAESWARPVPPHRMQEIAALFGRNCEVISPVSAPEEFPLMATDEETVLRLLARRPMRAEELCDSLNTGMGALTPLLRRLVATGLVERRLYEKEEFFTLRPPAH